jgi:HEAT repeat protein
MDDPQVEQHIANLTDMDQKVRRSAASELGKIGNASAVSALIKTLRDENYHVRWNAASALGEIGDVSSIPNLIKALKDEHASVRYGVAKALGEFSDTSAVLALIEALKDEAGLVRWGAVGALGKIGDVSAIPALIETLKLKESSLRTAIAHTLAMIGDSNTLPRKILADSRFSVQERINLLERLRRVRSNVVLQGSKVTLRYEFPETSSLCQAVLNEKDADARAGAQTVLNWLNGDRLLLHASQSDPGKLAQELIRPAQGGDPETQSETLLRAGQEPDSKAEDVPPQPTVWQRLFGKRNGVSL